MAISYRKDKQSSEWKVFWPVSEMRVGPITVTQKNGSTKTETVVRLSKSFLVEGIAHCYGDLAPKDSESTPNVVPVAASPLPGGTTRRQTVQDALIALGSLKATLQAMLCGPEEGDEIPF